MPNCCPHCLPPPEQLAIAGSRCDATNANVMAPCEPHGKDGLARRQKLDWQMQKRNMRPGACMTVQDLSENYTCSYQEAERKAGFFARSAAWEDRKQYKGWSGGLSQRKCPSCAEEVPFVCPSGRCIACWEQRGYECHGQSISAKCRCWPWRRPTILCKSPAWLLISSWTSTTIRSQPSTSTYPPINPHL